MNAYSPTKWVPAFFRSPDPQDWSPHIQKGLAACRRLRGVLKNHQVIENGEGYVPTKDPGCSFAWLVPAETTGRILAAGSCFWKPVFPPARQCYYYVWILYDGSLDISELKEHLDWAEREAVRAWEAREQTAGEA